MKKKLIALFSLLCLTVLIFAGCGSENTSKSAGGSYTGTETGADSAGSIEVSEAPTDTRKIIETVSYTAQTKEFDSFISALQEKILSSGGYIESSTVYGNEYNSSGSRMAIFKARIPQKESSDFSSYIESNSNVTRKEISTDDITLKYVDVQSRISALEKEKASLEAMLEKAESTDSLLKIKDQLTDVIYQLDSYKSQLKTYDNLVDYSTVNITVNEVRRFTASENTGVWTKIGENLSENFEAVGTFLVNAFIFIVSALPYILLVSVPGVIVLIIIFARRKKNKK